MRDLLAYCVLFLALGTLLAVPVALFAPILLTGAVVALTARAAHWWLFEMQDSPTLYAWQEYVFGADGGRMIYPQPHPMPVLALAEVQMPVEPESIPFPKYERQKNDPSLILHPVATYESLSYREMQKECKVRGIPATGNKETLRQRLSDSDRKSYLNRASAATANLSEGRKMDDFDLGGFVDGVDAYDGDTGRSEIDDFSGWMQDGEEGKEASDEQVKRRRRRKAA